MGLTVASCTCKQRLLKCARKYGSRAPRIDMSTVFTNHKLPSIHSVSVPRSRSKAIAFCCTEKWGLSPWEKMRVQTFEEIDTVSYK